MEEETLVVEATGMVAAGREAAIVEAAAMAMTVVKTARKAREAAAMGTEATRLAARKEGVQEAVEVAAAQAVAEMAEGRVVRLVAHMEVVQGAGLEEHKVAGEAVAEEMAAVLATAREAVHVVIGWELVRAVMEFSLVEAMLEVTAMARKTGTKTVARQAKGLAKEAQPELTEKVL